MNWDAIGAIAELLGAMGVIATLIYLAIQVGQNTSTLESASESDLATQHANWHALAANNSEIIRVFDMGSSNSLEDAHDIARYRWFIAQYFYICESAYGRFVRGQLAEETWEAYVLNLLRFLSVEIVREWWDGRFSQFSPGFREFIDNAVDSDRFANNELGSAPIAGSRPHK